MTDWDFMSTADMRRVLEILHKQLWDMALHHRDREILRRVRGFVLSELGEPGAAPWQGWFPTVASLFLYRGDNGQLSAHVFDHVIAAARTITERPLPSAWPAFPGEEPNRCWSGWGLVGTEPPIKRLGQPVVAPRAPQWLAPEYDVWQWDVMYDLLTRLENLHTLNWLELHPLPGIDPEIVYPPELGGDPAYDLDVAVASRPPMGLVVATLLAREIAYLYGGEIACEAIGDWIFAILTDKPPGPSAQPPDWLEPGLRARFEALEPAAMLAFCQRALEHVGTYMEDQGSRCQGQ